MRRAIATIISTIAFHPILAILFLPFILIFMLYADWKGWDADILK